MFETGLEVFMAAIISGSFEFHFALAPLLIIQSFSEGNIEESAE